MSRLLKLSLPVLLLGLATAASVAMIKARPKSAHKPPALPTLLVGVQELVRHPVRLSVSTQGSVSPRTQTTLVSEVAGQVTHVAPAFVVGGTFKAGDVLVQIDRRNYETQFKRARASVARAETQVATENALAGYAADDWQRLRGLNAARKPASALTLRKPQLAQALAELESAEAELEKASGDLERTVIRAPYDGMVRNKQADIGQFVNTGAAIATIFAIDHAEVRLPLTQQDLSYIDIEGLDRGETLPVELTATVGATAKRWHAQIVRSEGVVDTASRVIYIVAQVDDPYDTRRSGTGPLRMGTFVTATIEGREAGDLFVVPRHAVQRGNTVWIVDADDRIQPRPVTVVRTDDTRAFVDADIAAGTLLSITPISQPLPGTRVQYTTPVARGSAYDAPIVDAAEDVEPSPDSPAPAATGVANDA